MRRLAVAVVAVAVLVAGCGDDSSSGGGTPEISVEGAFVPTPAGANGAVYFEIVNRGDGADHLVGVTTDAADDAQIHESTTSDDGLSRMEHLDDVEVPAGGTVVFEPGGLHVMLLDVDELSEGDSIEVVLEFEESGPITIEAAVQPYGDGQY